MLIVSLYEMFLEYTQLVFPVKEGGRIKNEWKGGHKSENLAIIYILLKMLQST